MSDAVLTVHKLSAWVPASTEVWEDAQIFKWAIYGTTGNPRLDARFAAEDAEWRHPVAVWENEGGAL